MGTSLLLCAVLLHMLELLQVVSAGSIPVKCGLGFKQCKDGSNCVPYSHVCDGESDCADGSDEEDCAAECNEDQFQCAHGRLCIDQGEVCDGVPQCQDRSDELECTKKQDGCVHTCDNKGRCLPATFLCDGERDCLDGTDEADCDSEGKETSEVDDKRNGSTSVPGSTVSSVPAPVKCSPGFKPCRNGMECVHYNHVCDGEVDCRDGSDEDDCLSDCPTDQFQCAHGKKCIDQNQVCDGVPQCQDRSDELRCSEHMEGCTHQCDDKSRCIPPSFLCDGESDCADGTDEENCAEGCSASEFTCANDQCVPATMHCDGHADCWDRSDEEGCTTPAVCTAEHHCPHSKECLVQEWLCDGYQDCKDGADEKDCPVAQLNCGDYQWPCKSKTKCVPTAWKCDGMKDCDDGSDEMECESLTCTSHQFQCGSQECLASSLVCNGVTDCVDNSDEGVSCLIKCSEADEARCSQTCFSTPQGPRCGCAAGFSLMEDGVTCVDIDECEGRSPAVCSQLCRNIIGSYQCDCKPGYKMDVNGWQCKIDVDPSGEPFLLASVEMDLFLFGLHSGNMDVLSFTAKKPILCLDYDWREQKIFWFRLDTDSIRWSSFDKKTSGTLIKGVRADSIAVDWLGRNLYWVDNINSQINAIRLTTATVHPADHSVILDQVLDQPCSLALFPQKGLMFWSEIGNVVKIERAGMDGSERRALVNSSLGWPGGVTVDTVSERVYWTDERLRAIGSATLDGDDIQILQMSKSTTPFSLTVLGDVLYWSDPRKRMVQAVDKMTGKNQRVVLKRPRQPFAVKMVHAVIQMGAESPCENMQCSHLCVLAPGSRAVCKCPSGHLLAEDGLSCSSLVSSAFLLMLSPSTVTKIYLQGRHTADELRGWPEHVALNVPGMNEASIMDYSLRDHSLFLTDGRTSSLCYFKLEDRILAPGGQIIRLVGDTITAMALDWITLNIYWSSSKQSHLLVTSATGAHTAVLIKDNIGNLGSIALHPSSGKVCFSNVDQQGPGTDTQANVECAHMNGAARRVVWKNAIQPTSLVFSSNGDQIYWADTSLGIIGSVLFDGSGHKEFKAGTGLTAVALSDDMLVWVTVTDKARLWYRDEQQEQKLWFAVSTEVVSLKAFSKSSQTGSNQCAENNGNCQHLCLAGPNSRTCECAYDQLLINATHCAPREQCPAGSRLCLDQVSCQPADKFCNGIIDCPDHSDENCVHLMQGDEFAAPKWPRSFSPSPSAPPPLSKSTGPNTPALNASNDLRSWDAEQCSQIRCSARGHCVEMTGNVACVCMFGYRGDSCEEHLLKTMKQPIMYGAAGICAAVLVIVVLVVALKRRNTNSSRENPELKETSMTNLGTKVEAAPTAPSATNAEEVVSPVD